ncbi:hypothetical protein F3N42_05790 [Marinihelvus fidelis]|uniref:Uncharacterized protein n=1 Tax=Marinihelvus fidelis TaxID=2613842 RepID=A0A5N0TE41_9GAMM|nr:hypothetical protein [Marinihelvus fidelis]KAA9132724.1 hypothetical protein F3N42_05790 [Marinihelvus fidelis]
MKRLMIRPAIWLGMALAMFTYTASAAMVQKFDLGGLVGNADKVFRGTVLSKEPGVVSAGGGELATVVYTLRVDDAIKGDFGQGKAASLVTLQMVGDLKSEPGNGQFERLASFNINPDLDVGGDYVLFTTAPSSVGLSTTVGLNQGLFRVFANAQGREMTANGLDNSGLFQGAVEYAELVSAIKAEIK